MNTGKIIPDCFIHPYFLLKIFLSQQSEDYGEKWDSLNALYYGEQ